MVQTEAVCSAVGRVTVRSRAEIFEFLGPCERNRVGFLLKEISAIERAVAVIFLSRQESEEVPERLLLGSEANIWGETQVSCNASKSFNESAADDVRRGILPTDCHTVLVPHGERCIPVGYNARWGR